MNFKTGKSSRLIINMFGIFNNVRIDWHRVRVLGSKDKFPPMIATRIIILHSRVRRSNEALRRSPSMQIRVLVLENMGLDETDNLIFFFESFFVNKTLSQRTPSGNIAIKNKLNFFGTSGMVVICFSWRRLSGTGLSTSNKTS